ncbi:MAG: hypothetical protein CMJ18_19280 [Phycisphaeraceae bacterium]|nr:hypothetical protein [Phycisphaeraceae bacterium]
MPIARGNRYRSRRGITLVDLLVTMALLSMLVALLLPVISYAKEATRRVTCAGNLRHLGTAILMYAGDHRGSLLPTFRSNRGYGQTVVMVPDAWRELSRNHASDAFEIFDCPNLAGLSRAEFEGTRYKDQWLYLGYAYLGMSRPPNVPAYRLFGAPFHDGDVDGRKNPHEVTEPPDVPLLADLALSASNLTALTGIHRDVKWWHVAHLQGGFGASRIINWHEANPRLKTFGSLAGANHFYLGGHVVWHGPDALTPKLGRGWWKDGPEPYGLPF